jgi:hypothetical protein
LKGLIISKSSYFGADSATKYNTAVQASALETGAAGTTGKGNARYDHPAVKNFGFRLKAEMSNKRKVEAIASLEEEAEEARRWFVAEGPHAAILKVRVGKRVEVRTTLSRACVTTTMLGLFTVVQTVH